MKIVLDTNVLSELMKPQGLRTVKNWVAMQPRENLFITSITQAEILYGIAILPDGKRSQTLRETAQAMFIEDFEGQILAFEERAAVCFAQIAAHRRQIGKPISQADAQIAAICLANNAGIATRNIDDFQDCQIAIVNPWNL
jgi:toxin FitB